MEEYVSRSVVYLRPLGFMFDIATKTVLMSESGKRLCELHVGLHPSSTTFETTEIQNFQIPTLSSDTLSSQEDVLSGREALVENVEDLVGSSLFLLLKVDASEILLNVKNVRMEINLFKACYDMTPIGATKVYL